jgi:predicted ABC-type ATPase
MTIIGSQFIYRCCPNGVGKTTFAREFLPQYADCRNFINADLIAQGVAPFAPETAAVRAGRIMLEEIEDYARQGIDLVLKPLFPVAVILICSAI